jgi:tetratricopeptide (TPR) repeat protein
MPIPFDDMTPSHALLLSWLAADTPAERQHLLATQADLLTPELMADLLEIARGGPSYGDDRQAEARFQMQLLELAAAVAERVGSPEERSETQRMLAASLADLPGSEEHRAEVLAEAVASAEQAERWEAAYKAQLDLARLKHALGRGREALAAYEQALTLSLNDPALLRESEEVLEALVRLSSSSGRSSAARASVKRYMEAARRRGDRLELGHALTLAGRHYLALDLPDEARPVLQEAVALLGEMGDDDSLVRAHLRLLELAYESSDVVAAMRHVEEVVRLRDRVADPVLLAEIEEQFGQFF